MTDEEKKAADAKAAQDAATQAQADQEAKKAEEEAATAAAVAKVAEQSDLIKKLEEERDNYKTVALKRLGKLPGDAGFLEGADEKTGLTVEEMVKRTLLEREITKAQQDKDAETTRLAKENAELKLALKNRPGGSQVGSDQGASAEVKDNVFSTAQLAELERRAKRIGANPETFIANAKKNLQGRS